jgi:hypothetical protein
VRAAWTERNILPKRPTGGSTWRLRLCF